MSRTLLASLVALAALLTAPALAADLEDTLDARWRGRWVIVRAPLASDCSNNFTDNDVEGGRVSGRGAHRFDAGELARVDHVATKWGGRLDVFLELAEQLLEARTDGPFTLYEPKSCRVQLRFPGAGKQGVAEAEEAIGRQLEAHATAPEAEASPAWNRRRRAPLPPDYEQTLAVYREWKVTQTNVAVQARMNRAIDDAVRIHDRIREDPEYLAGFAAGIARVRDDSLGSCATLVDATCYPDVPRGKSDAYKSGYEDGQRLAFAVSLLQALRSCFLTVPN